MNRFVLGATLAVSLGFAASETCAQFTPGNLAIVNNNAIVEFDLATGQASNRVASPLWFLFERSILMDRNNIDLLTVLNTNPRHLIRVTPAGVITSVLRLPSAATNLVWGDDGMLFVGPGRATTPNLFRILSNSITTLLAKPVLDATIDPTTGDIVAVESSSGGVIRIDRISGAVTSLFARLGSVPGNRQLAITPATGDVMVAFTNGVEIRDRSGRVKATIGPAYGAVFEADPATGDFVLASLPALFAPIDIKIVSPAGTVKRTWPAPVTHGFTFYGSQKVHGAGQATRGTLYLVKLAFTAAGAGKNYAVLLSLAGTHPGTVLADGRRVHLAPDGLFAWTATVGDLPPFTRGLRGMTAAGGTATARLTIPRGLPRGTRLFASAIVVDPQAPLGVDVGNVIAIVVR